MNFFESIKQGVIGLLLFTGNWLSPGDDAASLAVVSMKKITPATWKVTIKMEMPLNRRLEELVDAGIPLNFRFTAISDRADTAATIRSLRCNVVDLTYTFTDSASTMVTTSKKYPMILLALRDFSRWEFTLPYEATACAVEAEILYSRVSQLNRSVDMSKVWGHQKLRCGFMLKDEKK
ncbi:MAG: hypothetical protein JXA71_03910 [Chitinispirillaceae bacterium]|nr:hypothetical protein [Chitinispirillaceae bacterium]